MQPDNPKVIIDEIVPAEWHVDGAESFIKKMSPNIRVVADNDTIIEETDQLINVRFTKRNLESKTENELFKHPSLVDRIVYKYMQTTISMLIWST
jgi:hypothetical protein